MNAPRSPWASLSRTSCDECGGTKLRWMEARDLAFEVAPGDRLRVFEVIDFTGQRADAWMCPDCGNWGIFDRTHPL